VHRTGPYKKVQASGRPLILGDATKTAVVDTRPRRSSFVLFADFIEARGCDFYRLVCVRDLEGIVAKWKAALTVSTSRRPSWIKIKNPEYSQARDGAELYHR
jgi:ATP-dependent DNA ligase